MFIVTSGRQTATKENHRRRGAKKTNTQRDSNSLAKHLYNISNPREVLFIKAENNKQNRQPTFCCVSIFDKILMA